MSLWSPNDLRVVLNPDHVAVVRLVRTLTLRGPRRAPSAERVVACDPDADAMPWRAALKALETVLPDFAGDKTAATVIISNHFMRYVLVPWSADLTEPDEEMALMQHRFAKVYGEAAKHWTLRLNQEKRGLPRLASALDAGFLEGLNSVFDQAGVAITSIQPSLMAVFNGVRERLRARNAWFALVEPGNLCLALLHAGSWNLVRNLRIGVNWNEELALILDREAYLSDLAAATRDVFVWASGQAEVQLTLSEPWTVQVLSTPSGIEPERQGHLAIARGA